MDLQQNLTSLFCAQYDSQMFSNSCWQKSNGTLCSLQSPIDWGVICVLPVCWQNYEQQQKKRYYAALRAIQTDGSAYLLATTKWFHAVSLCLFSSQVWKLAAWKAPRKARLLNLCCSVRVPVTTSKKSSIYLRLNLQSEQHNLTLSAM